VVNEDWLRAEIGDYTDEAGVEFLRGEYLEELESLRLKLLAEPRLRAVLRKSNGKPSAPSQFKRLESLTVGWFKQAIRRKAKYAHGKARPRSKVEESLVGVSEFVQRTDASEDEP